ncbi:MAG: preprotein translocase subunit YajC [Actinomycetota bacterium]|nr:preprotein translocase subunit YajC [Actinomycetota bacterium]
MQSPVGNLIFIFVLFLVFWLFLIRPQKKRMEAQRALIESIEEGDEIITMGGIVGTVRGLEDDEMQVEVAPGTSIRILRSAVARKVVEEEPDEVGDVGEEEERA